MSAVGRLIRRRGKTWNIQYWVEGGVNAYRRTNKTLSAPIPFLAIRTETAKERAIISARGEERTLDAQLLILEDLDVSDIEDTTKISPVITSPTGIQYDAITLGREGEVMKFNRIFLSKRRSIGEVTLLGGFDTGFNNGFDI